MSRHLTHPEPGSRLTPLRTGLVMATLCLCGTVTSLQQTIVVPLLPELPHLLGTTADNVSWLVTATLLTGAVATPVVSRLADMFGKRLMVTVCLLLMVAGSVLGALADSLAEVITARSLQGVGMALIPVGIAIMRDELPWKRVPLGVALMSATLAVGAGAGLPLSGIIAAHLDWHAIFWVTGAAGAVMLVAVRLLLRESPVRTGGAFDYGGALLLTIALTAVLLMLSKGGQWGWTSRLTLLTGFGGLLVLLVWVPVELRTRNPLVNVRTAARPAVSLVNTASVLLGFGMFANLLVTTQLLQLPQSTGYGLGLDVVETGIWMAPSALVFGALAPVSAALTRRFSPQTTLVAGASGMAVAYVARVYLSHELWQIVVGSMLVSVGTSLAYATIAMLIMRAVPVTETAAANGLNTLLRSVGTSTSSATVAAVITMGAQRIGDTVYPTFDALMLVFWVAGAACALGALVVLPLLRMPEFSEDRTEAADGRPRTTAVHGPYPASRKTLPATRGSRRRGRSRVG